MPTGIMEIIPPMEMTDARLTSSDVPENDEAEWNIATAYIIDDLVMVTDDGVHNIYSCTVANTGNYPPDTIYNSDDESGFWSLVSATNRWRMFDKKTKSKTLQSGTITKKITPGRIYNSVAGFGLVADTVNINIVNGTTEVYNRDIDMKDLSDIGGYYDWFFQPLSNKEQFVYTDLPAYASAVMTVTFSNGSDVCEVGELIVGKFLEVGVAEYGTNIGIIDFSRKVEDEETEEVTIEKRKNYKTVEYGILLETSRVNIVRKVLYEYTSTPMVFVGEETLPETIIYGFTNDFTIELQNKNTSYCSLQAEELI